MTLRQPQLTSELQRFLDLPLAGRIVKPRDLHRQPARNPCSP